MAAPSDAELIRIRGAREHNLQNVDVDLPRERLVVITGLSGSGKSSLAFDTLYAEGQRRYVESLSAYARQFLDQLQKPDVEDIDGLSPAISIEQKTAGRSPRSTVGTITEIYDHLRLLYARVGRPHCWECGRPIAAQTVQQMTDRVLSLPEGTRAQIMAPVVRGRKGAYRKELAEFARQGFVRARIDGAFEELADEIRLARGAPHDIDLVVDRIAVRPDAAARVAESLETALRLAGGLVTVDVGPGAEEWVLSRSAACVACGNSFPEIAPRLFSFNSPAGACPACGGLGTSREIDPARLVPDGSRSLARGAIEPWTGRRRRYYTQLLEAVAEHLGVDPEVPWDTLPADAQRAVFEGTGSAEITFVWERRRRRQTVRRRFDGVLGDLERRRRAGEEIPDRYLAPRPCDACEGTRLRPEARAIALGSLSIDALVQRSVAEVTRFLDDLVLEGTEHTVAERVLSEIRERLAFLADVGLDYLTLDRPAATLSGGESQRIRLATQVGASLMGVLYILDEPSIGLHARDHARLLDALVRLRDLGNSVVVVEHDEATIRAADHVLDMGPGAGIHGGHVVAQGPPEAIEANPESLTGAYLSGRRAIAVPSRRRPARDKALVMIGCRQHNLHDVTLRVPLGLLVAVTGVSGSGKSTLVSDTLYRELARRLHGAKEPPGGFGRLRGADEIDKVVDVSQAPIGRTPRSNPATYVGLFDVIRRLFSQVPEARARGYGPGRFSFNVKGGRCESCQGDGALRVEMHFLPDIFVDCEVCAGRRYNRETLEVTYKGKSIADVLEMSVEEALVLLENVPTARRPLQTLHDVGLDYVHLGQPATTLSGGEAQRIKLARELSRKQSGRTLYILDEPTTGLHFADVEKLLEVLSELVDRGNTVLVIEHQLDVIKTADWVIDLGPEGGEKGGEIVAEGTPEEVAQNPLSYTGRALAPLLFGPRTDAKA